MPKHSRKRSRTRSPSEHSWDRSMSKRQLNKALSKQGRSRLFSRRSRSFSSKSRTPSPASRKSQTPPSTSFRDSPKERKHSQRSRSDIQSLHSIYYQRLLFKHFQKKFPLSADHHDSEGPPIISAALTERFQQLSKPEAQPAFDLSFNQQLLTISDKPFEKRADIKSYACNPNAPYAYGFPRRIQESCILELFERRPLRPEGETAESLRDQQQAQLVEVQIRRAGNYIRQGQNFEAIQCCNNALNLMPGSTDALLGRAIASNNMENFVSAVVDLDKILQISPEHSRARFIIEKVLMQQAENFEELRQLDQACKTYQRAHVEFGNQEAGETLKRLEKQIKQQNSRDLIDLTAEDDDKADHQQSSQKPTQEDLDAVARRKRLNELEHFKQSLARRKK